MSPGAYRKAAVALVAATVVLALMLVLTEVMIVLALTGH